MNGFVQFFIINNRATLKYGWQWVKVSFDNDPRTYHYAARDGKWKPGQTAINVSGKRIHILNVGYAIPVQPWMSDHSAATDLELALQTN